MKFSHFYFCLLYPAITSQSSLFQFKPLRNSLAELLSSSPSYNPTIQANQNIKPPCLNGDCKDTADPDQSRGLEQLKEMQFYSAKRKPSKPTKARPTRIRTKLTAIKNTPSFNTVLPGLAREGDLEIDDTTVKADEALEHSTLSRPETLKAKPLSTEDKKHVYLDEEDKEAVLSAKPSAFPTTQETSTLFESHEALSEITQSTLDEIRMNILQMSIFGERPSYAEDHYHSGEDEAATAWPGVSESSSHYYEDATSNLISQEPTSHLPSDFGDALSFNDIMEGLMNPSQESNQSDEVNNVQDEEEEAQDYALAVDIDDEMLRPVTNPEANPYDDTELEDWHYGDDAATNAANEATEPNEVENQSEVIGSIGFSAPLTVSNEVEDTEKPVTCPATCTCSCPQEVKVERPIVASTDQPLAGFSLYPCARTAGYQFNLALQLCGRPGSKRR